MLGALVAGALLAPPLFNFLLWLGRTVPALEFLRDTEFESLISRILLILVLCVVLPMALRRSRLHWRDLGWTSQAGWWRPMTRAWLVGVVSMGLLFVMGWALKAYVFEPQSAGRIARAMATYLVGALLVGVIEETLFRGALFGFLRGRLGFWRAAVIGSFLFSVVHFARPQPATGVVYGHWTSGFSLVPGMFKELMTPYNGFPSSLTLFLMGFVLCAFYDRFGSLYVVAGLHAGWVWAMRIGTVLFTRDGEVLDGLFGRGMDISKTYVVLWVALAFLVVSLWMRGGGWAADKTEAR
jgi:uncharacterized protein